jgi:hypothetical protein
MADGNGTNGNGTNGEDEAHFHVERSAPLERVLFVTGIESVPIVAIPEDGNPSNMPPMVGLQLHADEVLLSDGHTSNHLTFEFALPVETALILQMNVAQTLVEVNVSTCEDPTCPVHKH